MGLPKVQSKAGKLKIKRAARRVRPLTLNVAREPNGRISRRTTLQEPANRLALAVRARKLGVGVEEARDPRLATYIGRLAILGAEKGVGGISGAQYDAAQTFLEVRNHHQTQYGRSVLKEPLAKRKIRQQGATSLVMRLYASHSKRRKTPRLMRI